MFENRQKLMELIGLYHKAVSDNDLIKVEEYLDREDAPETLVDQEYYNVSPILYAAQEGFWDMTLKLFERQADLDVKTDPFSWYLIHECIVNAPDKVFRNIVKYADFTVKTSDGKNPLMVAIEKGRFDRAMFLLENKKAVIYDKDNHKRTALHYAAIQNNKEVFLELVKRGANVFEEDKDKKNAMDLLTDEIFRNSLPTLLENMKIELAEPKKKDTLETVISEPVIIVEKEEVNDKPKISSLGKLVKKK